MTSCPVADAHPPDFKFAYDTHIEFQQRFSDKKVQGTHSSGALSGYPVGSGHRCLHKGDRLPVTTSAVTGWKRQRRERARTGRPVETRRDAAATGPGVHTVRSMAATSKRDVYICMYNTVYSTECN